MEERGIYTNRERKPREIVRDVESDGEGIGLVRRTHIDLNRRYEIEGMREKIVA